MSTVRYATTACIFFIGLCGWLQGYSQPLVVRINGVVVTDCTFSAQASNILSIKLTHTPTDTAQYAYRLEGLDAEWSEYRQVMNMLYHQLPGGTYYLLIRVNQDHTPVKKIRIRVDPLLWQRWWFLPFIYFCIFLLLATGLYFSYLYKLHQQVRLLSVRENIARDLHDDMGSYLGSISVLSQSVLNVAQQDPQRARLLVDKIGEMARLVMDSMSDIVWAINPENDSMDQIIVRMRDVANDLLGSQDIAFYQTIDDAVSTVHLPLEQRRDFFLIYKEALTNIAKYAQAHQVWIRLQRNELGLVLNIHDDGVGFDPHQSAGQDPLGGNGLKNMRVRAEKLGGMFTIQSAPGQGTRLTLQISVT